jgi:hypothetical protein
VDVAGVDNDGALTVVGECKWSKYKVGLSVLRDLEQVIAEQKLPVATECQYVLFSKSGFTAELCERSASQDNLQLIDDIFAHESRPAEG